MDAESGEGYLRLGSVSDVYKTMKRGTVSLAAVLFVLTTGSMLLVSRMGQGQTLGSANEQTNLLTMPSMRGGGSRALAHPLPTTGAMTSGSSPLNKWQNLAMSLVEATNRCDGARVRDITMKAIDDETQEKVEEKVALKAKDMAGVTAPLGFWDPLGFSADAPEGKLLFYREVELKHGRICMLAALGFLVGESFHPLFGGNIDVPSYVAFQQTPLQAFWPAVVVALAVPEISSVNSFQPLGDGGALWQVKTDRAPGDFGFDPLGLKPSNPKDFKEMQTKELNNGRLAMIATAGMIAQELASGKKLF